MAPLITTTLALCIIALFGWRHWQHEARRVGWTFVPDQDTTPVVLQAALEVNRYIAFPLLKLRAPFTHDEVLAAYRRQAMKLHPDHGGAAGLFRMLVVERERALDVAGRV